MCVNSLFFPLQRFAFQEELCYTEIQDCSLMTKYGQNPLLLPVCHLRSPIHNNPLSLQWVKMTTLNGLSLGVIWRAEVKTVSHIRNETKDLKSKLQRKYTLLPPPPPLFSLQEAWQPVDVFQSASHPILVHLFSARNLV